MIHTPWQLRFTDEEYRKLSLLVAMREGICLGSGVRERVTCRVWQQMAMLHTASFDEYLRLVEGDPRSGMTRDLCDNLNFARHAGRGPQQLSSCVTA